MEKYHTLNIKKILKDFQQAEKEMFNNIVRLKSFIADEERLWIEIQKLEYSVLIDHRVIALLSDSLQLINNKELLKLADLQDIKHIHQLLVAYYPDNIQYQEDLVAFVYNVLDDEAEALLLIGKFERQVKITQNYFNKIKKEVRNR